MADSRINQYTDLQGLAALRRDARAQDPTALREAARQFESVFTKMMLASMRDASGGDPMFDSDESRFYRDMFDNQLSVEMSRGRGLGLAEMLVAQVKRSGMAPAGGESGRPAQLMALPAAAKAHAASSGPVSRPVTPIPASAPAATAAPSGSGTAAASAAAAAPADTKARPLPTGRTPTRHEFLDAILPAAEKAAAQLGVSARNLIAQAALETGWGRFLPRNADGSVSFNFFGIKATGGWRGASAAATTTEVLQGRAQRMVERFRAYANLEDSVADHARLIGRSKRYAAVRGTGDDALAFGTALQRGGYATAPDYARKIAAVADSVGRLLEVRRLAAADGAAKGRVERTMTAADVREVPGRS